MVMYCISLCMIILFFFFKQKTAYEMRISDWSSDVCSSDVAAELGLHFLELRVIEGKTETGLAAERQLDDLQQVARAAHHHVVGLARGLAGVARLRSKGLRLAGLGAAEQLDAITPQDRKSPQLTSNH